MVLRVIGNKKIRTETIGKDYTLKMDVEKMIQRRGKGNLTFLLLKFPQKKINTVEQRTNIKTVYNSYHFLEMKQSGNIVIGNKNSANIGNGNPALDQNGLISVSWRGKALCHLRTGCPIEGDIFMLFPSTKGNLRLFFSWSQVKTLLASPPIMPQVCRGDRKAIGFSQCCLHAFQENKTNHIQIQLLVCLSSSSILLEPETLPKPWTRKEGRGFGRLPG